MTCFDSPFMARSRGWSRRRTSGEPESSESVACASSWPAVALLALLAAGCAAPQPSLEPSAQPSPLESPAPIAVQPREAECAACTEIKGEIAQLQRRLTATESALSELRVQRIEQAKTVQEANREAARATVRLRRLATRGVAASYIAEVEVSMTNARLASGLRLQPAQLAQAQEILDSSREPFALGDYDAAISRASQAAELIARAQEPVLPQKWDRAPAAVHFAQPMPYRVRIDSNLRKGPSGQAPVRGVLAAGTPLEAYARRGNWVRVETADGRSGWIYRRLLGPQEGL